MRRLLFIALILIICSCEKPDNSYEIAISDVLHYKTFFTAENCNSDLYNNILIKNDTLFINGKINNEFGNYFSSIRADETQNLLDLINNINPQIRSNKKVNPTTGMTALIIKKNNHNLDSLVDYKTKWSKNDLALFNYIGELICKKKLKKIKNSINYPTWEMVKPPK